MTKRLLTKKRERWVKNRDVTLEGEELSYNIAEMGRYGARLEKLTQQMAEEMSREVKKLFKTSEAKDYFAQDASISSMTRITLNEVQKKYDRIFSRVAKPWAESMVSDADKRSRSKLHSSLEKLSGGLSLKTNFITGEMNEIIKGTIAENVDLIKSIPQTYFTEVKTAVNRSITRPDSTGIKGLIDDLDVMLDKRNKKVLNKAKNLALDQTRKTYNHLNAGRMEKVGITKFKWKHTGGGQNPREYHRDELDGKVFSTEDPPVIDKKTGEKGLPGDAINCRCTMIPVIEFGDDDD